MAYVTGVFDARPAAERVVEAQSGRNPHGNPRKPRRWWRVAMIAGVATTIIGGGVMLSDPSGAYWNLGLNLLVVGALGVAVAAIGAWMSRPQPYV